MHTPAQSLILGLRVETSGVPIYVQIRDQVLRALATGLLRAGDQMPTMRQVAVALKIDLNTVRHAYDELERAGALSLVRGRGSFVSDHPPPVDPEELARHVDDLAHQVLATARAQGIDPVALSDRLAILANQKELTS